MSRAHKIKETLRQMLALLEGERQALAALDLERIVACANGKTDLGARLDGIARADLDEESLGLIDAAKRLNDINWRLRNLIATNVKSRMETFAGAGTLYRPLAAHGTSRRRFS